MSVGYNPGLIGTTQVPSPFGSKLQNARAAGPVIPYDYKATKLKKQFKEIRKVLFPEKKRFLFVRYGHKFNVRHRCIVCGTQHHWEPSDPMRPTIPLTEVTKGRPMKGNYCPKHAEIWRQMEMLEQQMLAEDNGLEFSAYIPKPRVPQMLQRGPLKHLRPQDVQSLVSLGWAVKSPSVDKEEPPIEYDRLMVEVEANLKRISVLVKGSPEVEVEE
jgi:hypothetical protein